MSPIVDIIKRTKKGYTKEGRERYPNNSEEKKRKKKATIWSRSI